MNFQTGSETVIPARRAADDDPVEAIIRTLDEAIAEHFPMPRASRHHQDRAIARGWHEAGITAEFARDVIEPIVGRRAAEGGDAPQTLKFFLDAMLRARAAAGPALAAAKPSDPEFDAKARRYTDATREWSEGGRQGPSPKLEDFGLPPLDMARAH